MGLLAKFVEVHPDRLLPDARMREARGQGNVHRFHGQRTLGYPVRCRWVSWAFARSPRGNRTIAHRWPRSRRQAGAGPCDF